MRLQVQSSAVLCQLGGPACCSGLRSVLRATLSSFLLQVQPEGRMRQESCSKARHKQAPLQLCSRNKLSPARSGRVQWTTDALLAIPECEVLEQVTFQDSTQRFQGAAARTDDWCPAVTSSGSWG